jgi:hypothetical protein
MNDGAPLLSTPRFPSRSRFRTCRENSGAAESRPPDACLTGGKNEDCCGRRHQLLWAPRLSRCCVAPGTTCWLRRELKGKRDENSDRRGDRRDRPAVGSSPPKFIASLNICNADIHEAADRIGVGGNAERYRWFVGCRTAPRQWRETRPEQCSCCSSAGSTLKRRTWRSGSIGNNLLSCCVHSRWTHPRQHAQLTGSPMTF